MDGSSDSWSAGQLPTADSGLKEMNYSTLGLAMGVYCVVLVYAVVVASGNLVEDPCLTIQDQIYGSVWTRALWLASAPRMSLVLVILPDNSRASLFDARL